MLNLKQSDKALNIDIIGVIGQSIFDDGVSAKEIAEKLSGIEPDSTINVNIASPGGFVDEGLVIYDLLAKHPGPVNTTTSGLTGSMATVIAQAGKTRKMSKNGMYLIHRIQTAEMGTPTDLRAEADNAEAVENRLVQIYAKRTGRREATVRRLMAANKERGDWWDAETALDLGFIDEIVPDSKRAARADLEAMGIPITPEMQGKVEPEENKTQLNLFDMEEQKKNLDELSKEVEGLKAQKVDAELEALRKEKAELEATKSSEALAAKEAEAKALREEIAKLKAGATPLGGEADEGDPNREQSPPTMWDRMAEAMNKELNLHARRTAIINK